jgi:hypothetical protein
MHVRQVRQDSQEEKEGQEMTAMERIKELEMVIENALPNTVVPKRWGDTTGAIVPLEIVDDVHFLLKAFRVMREIAADLSWDAPRENRSARIEFLFEERMAKP